MDLYLGLFWQDPRFDLALNQSLTLGGDYTDKFWLPDTFFVNSVQTSVHETILPNKKVWINLYGGHMMLSARYMYNHFCSFFSVDFSMSFDFLYQNSPKQFSGRRRTPINQTQGSAIMLPH